MFTVIILSEAAKSIFDNSRVYFSPYEEMGDIAFCSWNQSPNARTLREVLPDLPAIIKGKSAWRAVVVDHPRNTKSQVRKARYDLPENRNRENPFDFLDNTQVELNLRHSNHALVRLSHVLLGYPSLSAKGFIPVITYRDADTNKRVEKTIGQAISDFLEAGVLTAQDQERLEVLAPSQRNEYLFKQAISWIGARHSDVSRIYKRQNYDSGEVKRHKDISRVYHMEELRPAEVYFIATRAPITPEENVELGLVWKQYEERDASRFVERNDYPPMTRFAVYEMLEEKNSGYEQDELRFWLSVLSLAVNQVPPSTFQADRLYRIGVSISSQDLSEMLNGHMSKLRAAEKVLDRLIKRPMPDSKADMDEILARQKIDVDFERVDKDQLSVTRAGYGLFTDRPVSEYIRWKQDFSQLAAKVRRFSRKPAQMLAYSTSQARQIATASPTSTLSLDDITRADIEETLNEQVKPLLLPATTNILDKKALKKELRKHELNVIHEIRERMTMPVALIAWVVALSVWVISFVPYLIAAATKGSASLRGGIVMTLVVLLVLSLSGLVALIGMWLTLRNKIAQLNDFLHQSAVDVQNGAKAFSAYLSRYVTYRRGRELLRGSLRAKEHLGEDRARWTRILERIKARRRDEREIVLSVGGDIRIERYYDGVCEQDFESEERVQKLYRFQPGDSFMPFNDSGEMIKAPYDFVSGFTLLRLPLYEPEPSQIFDEKEDDYVKPQSSQSGSSPVVADNQRGDQ